MFFSLLLGNGGLVFGNMFFENLCLIGKGYGCSFKNLLLFGIKWSSASLDSIGMAWMLIHVPLLLLTQSHWKFISLELLLKAHALAKARHIQRGARLLVLGTRHS